MRSPGIRRRGAAAAEGSENGVAEAATRTGSSPAGSFHFTDPLPPEMQRPAPRVVHARGCRQVFGLMGTAGRMARPPRSPLPGPRPSALTTSFPITAAGQRRIGPSGASPASLLFPRRGAAVHRRTQDSGVGSDRQHQMWGPAGTPCRAREAVLSSPGVVAGCALELRESASSFIGEGVGGHFGLRMGGGLLRGRVRGCGGGGGLRCGHRPAGVIAFGSGGHPVRTHRAAHPCAARRAHPARTAQGAFVFNLRSGRAGRVGGGGQRPRSLARSVIRGMKPSPRPGKYTAERALCPTEPGPPPPVRAVPTP